MSVGLVYAGNLISGPPSTVLAWSEAAMIDLIINNDTTSEKSNYLLCDRTNFRVPVEVGLRKDWTGNMVRPESLESQHPQDFIKSRGSQNDIGPQSAEHDNTFISIAVTQDDL